MQCICVCVCTMYMYSTFIDTVYPTFSSLYLFVLLLSSLTPLPGAKELQDTKGVPVLGCGVTVGRGQADSR